MKIGRDWSYWSEFVFTDAMYYIGKNIVAGTPFPISYKKIGWNEYRLKGSSIFTLKTWGKDGYK